MSEENIKKTEELNEAAKLPEGAELSEAELDGVAGGFGFGTLQSLIKHQEMERQAAEALAKAQCPYCGNVGAWKREDGAVFCNSCHAVL